MGRPYRLAVLSLAVICTGCGAESVLLEAPGSHLVTVADQLALPGEAIQLQAKVEAGDFLSSQPGLIVSFRRDGQLYKAAETDGEGVASVTFTPPAEGDYRFEVTISPVGMAGVPPEPRSLLVACRPADERMVVVDLDRTLVGSGFQSVLIGDPEPMAGSQDVLARLARTHTVVYLTHRPEHFGPKSKAWLEKHNYPPGPVLLSTVEQYLRGSGRYKSAALSELTQRFNRIEIGVGDKHSDALAYHENGLRSFWIVPLPEPDQTEQLKELAEQLAQTPPDVQVVITWEQISGVLERGESYRPARLAQFVSDMITLSAAEQQEP